MTVGSSARKRMHSSPQPGRLHRPAASPHSFLMSLVLIANFDAQGSQHGHRTRLPGNAEAGPCSVHASPPRPAGGIQVHALRMAHSSDESRVSFGSERCRAALRRKVACAIHFGRGGPRHPMPRTIRSSRLASQRLGFCAAPTMRTLGIRTRVPFRPATTCCPYTCGHSTPSRRAWAGRQCAPRASGRS